MQRETSGEIISHTAFLFFETHFKGNPEFVCGLDISHTEKTQIRFFFFFFTFLVVVSCHIQVQVFKCFSHHFGLNQVCGAMKKGRISNEWRLSSASDWLVGCMGGNLIKKNTHGSETFFFSKNRGWGLQWPVVSLLSVIQAEEEEEEGNQRNMRRRV